MRRLVSRRLTLTILLGLTALALALPAQAAAHNTHPFLTIALAFKRAAACP
jgi:hypothetical protein